MCCCGCSLCKICVLVLLLVIAIGLLFGFGVFKHGFEHLKNSVHTDYNGSSRPFLGNGGGGAPVHL
ncbi:hypothetical protein AQUCO_05500110v1 [Aquilegia coerulea]|uniref:Uncharacterized protein n=1 Tax=Aquilegia coerulea TaxID=218851 RepID=A0A2G5CIA8_AQUCA|nr:hypothetical protein AQUCO_05500110v1 [Aquilegia coerulea]